MATVYDLVHDLVTHPVDTVKGIISPAEEPSKPAYTHADASDALGGASGVAARKIGFRERQINKAVDDAS